MKQAMEKPKKILYLITKATWGGAQKYVYDLATHAPANFQPVLAYGEKGKLAEGLAGAGIAMHELLTLGRDVAVASDIKCFFEVVRLLRKEKPDVLHLNSSKAAALGALAGRFAGVRRIIFTAHGWPFKEERGPISKTLIRFISWLTALLSHAVIVVSKEDEILGKRMPFVASKIRYIPLAIRKEQIQEKAEVERMLFNGISASFLDSIRLVTIAELTANKGLKYSIDMMVDLERRAPGKYKYAIFGDGEERSLLTSYAEEKEIQSRVWFVNVHPPTNVSPAQLSSEAGKFLPGFDIFILPSIKEGMPYVLLEAAAAGLPIVATDIVEQEAGNLSNIRFVKPRSGSELADAVELIANNMPTRAPLSFDSFDKMLLNTIALY